MERMTPFKTYEPELWKLLEKQKLAELSQYHQRGFFDEVPLYTRESEVRFLRELNGEGAKTLLRFSLKFLKSIIAYEEHAKGYLAAVTFWNFTDTFPVPNFFIACEAVRRLDESLSLRPVTSAFGKHMKKVLASVDASKRFDILEDSTTVPGTPRVLMALARPPYRGYVTLNRFRKSAKAST
jgi:hypothetical protein